MFVLEVHWQFYLNIKGLDSFFIAVFIMTDVVLGFLKIDIYNLDILEIHFYINFRYHFESIFNLLYNKLIGFGF